MLRERLGTPVLACVYLLHSWQQHILACNRHETECFLLQESTDRMCLGACLLRSIAILIVSEYHRHPSVRHLATRQSISLGQKVVHEHHSAVMCPSHFCRVRVASESRALRGRVVWNVVESSQSRVMTWSSQSRVTRMVESLRVIVLQARVNVG